MKKAIITVVLVLLAIAAGVAVWWWMQHRESEQEIQEGEETLNEHTTNSVIYFEDETPSADPLMVGRWTCVDKDQWHKVYYDDYDDEQRCFWGKEWDESEDVMEEDLSWHGNGWFRWEKRKDTLVEYHTMDMRDVPISHRYIIRLNDSTDISQVEIAHRSSYHFVKQ